MVKSANIIKVALNFKFSTMKKAATLIIRLSLIALLGYAAMSKLTAWQEFYHQLNEISFFEGIGWWVAILVPLVELIIVVLLR